MRLLLTFAQLILLHLLTANSQGLSKSGCFNVGQVLICKTEVPTVYDLESGGFKTLVVTSLPEGSWLSVGETEGFLGANIQKIEIQNSNVGRVDPGYFALVSGNNKLKRLHLRKVKGPVVVDKAMLQGLEKSLNYLMVWYSLSVNIADLAEMEALTELELVGTNLIGTPADFEKILPRLRSLEIKDSNLNQLPWEAVAKWVDAYDSRSLKINENKWHCDCSIAALKRLQPSVVKSDLGKLTCVSPPNLAGRQLVDITEAELCPQVEEEKPIHPSQGGSNVDAGKDGGEHAKDGKTEESGVRTEVIIAGTVVGAIILAFVIFIIVYKCRIQPTKKSKEERASRTHQNKRYVNVIEEPPISQYPSNNGAPGSPRHGQGSSV